MKFMCNAVFQKKFITLNFYIKKEERSKLNNLSFHYRKIKKENELNSK